MVFHASRKMHSSLAEMGVKDLVGDAFELIFKEIYEILFDAWFHGLAFVILLFTILFLDKIHVKMVPLNVPCRHRSKFLSESGRH